MLCSSKEEDLTEGSSACEGSIYIDIAPSDGYFPWCAYPHVAANCGNLGPG